MPLGCASPPHKPEFITQEQGETETEHVVHNILPQFGHQPQRKRDGRR